MKTKEMLLLAGAGALTLPVAATGNDSGMRQSDRPNVLIIMCDDMGYGDLGCYGQPYISTPCIDSMAAQGLRFTQAYAGSPVSAPSRASLMTGQHSGHCEVRGNKEYWRDVPTVKYGRNTDFSIVGQHPYDSAHIVLPEIFKDRGYNTGMFGKWAGGYEGSRSVPEKRGIDEYFGYICQFQAHLYYPNFLNRFSRQAGDTATVRVVLEDNIEYPMFGPDYNKRPQYSADIIHSKAMEWLGSQSADKPFFGLLTYTLPHAELVQPDDSIVASYRARFAEDSDWPGQEGSRYNATTHTHAQFAAMITRLDTYVGDILRLLREKGLDRNTLVIFTSDNGPHEEGGADPTFFGRDGKLRGLKRQIHEGGIRVPFIAYWPGTIRPGRTSDLQIAFYDIMPTMARLTGVSDFPGRYANPDVADDRFDGISFYPTLMDQPGQAVHPFLYWEFDETDQIGVREGDWKLIVKSGKPHLYNLADDIHEDNDIAAGHPDIVNRLINIIEREHTPNPYFHVTMPKKE
mgnify:CR=1 FL=1